jgi:hypothetical protein
MYKLFIEMTVFWDVAPCSLVEGYQRVRGPCCLHHQGREYWLITLMMAVAGTFETSVNLYQTTRRNIPKDSLHTRRCDNLKSYKLFIIFCLEVEAYNMMCARVCVCLRVGVPPPSPPYTGFLCPVCHFHGILSSFETTECCPCFILLIST